MTYKPVSWNDELRKEILSDPESRAIYEATKLQIELSMQLREARKKRHMTQDDVAEIMHTHKPVISRLESGDEDVQHFPSLLTIAKFASAVGYEIKLALIPMKKIRLKKDRKKEK